MSTTVRLKKKRFFAIAANDRFLYFIVIQLFTSYWFYVFISTAIIPVFQSGYVRGRILFFIFYPGRHSFQSLCPGLKYIGLSGRSLSSPHYAESKIRWTLGMTRLLWLFASWILTCCHSERNAMKPRLTGRAGKESFSSFAILSEILMCKN